MDLGPWAVLRFFVNRPWWRTMAWTFTLWVLEADSIGTASDTDWTGSKEWLLRSSIKGFLGRLQEWHGREMGGQEFRPIIVTDHMMQMGKDDADVFTFFFGGGGAWIEGRVRGGEKGVEGWDKCPGLVSRLAG